MPRREGGGEEEGVEKGRGERERKVGNSKLKFVKKRE